MDKFFSLRFLAGTPLEPLAPNDEILKYRIGLIPHIGEDFEPGPEIGHFSVWRFNIGTYREHGEYSLFALFDEDSTEAAALYEALFDLETEDFNQKVLGEDIFFSDLLYFQLASFGKEWKNSSILLAAAERIIQTIGNGCAVTALWLGDEPYPKQDDFSVDEVFKFWESQKESESFWGRIGFKRVPETFFLARNLALISPSIPEILGHDTTDG